MILLRGSQLKLTEKQAQFRPKSSKAVDQVAQRSCAASIVGGFRDDSK